MPFIAHTPSAPLSAFVEMLWYYRCDELPRHRIERLMPGGTLEFVINLDEDRFDTPCGRDLTERTSGSGTLAVGAYSCAAVIEPPIQRLLGVHFRPGGAVPFLGLPADELHNLDVALPDLWGAEASRLRDELDAARDIAALFRVMESTLLRRLHKAPARHPAVGFALREFQATPCSVNDVADRAGLSQRRLTQLFSAAVGLTPKLYQRVTRFQRAIATVHPQREVDWTTIAQDCGYYDQAHFNHDFRDFSGFTPGEYQSLKSEHLNHVPLD